MYNCANCHITNTKEHFVDYTPYTEANLCGLVNTIGAHTKPAGVGTVCWSWRDDQGRASQYDLPGCRYYPTSPVCILSQTQLKFFLKVKTSVQTLNRAFALQFSIGIINAIKKPLHTPLLLCLKWWLMITFHHWFPYFQLSETSLMIMLDIVSSLIANYLWILINWLDKTFNTQRVIFKVKQLSFLFHLKKFLPFAWQTVLKLTRIIISSPCYLLNHLPKFFCFLDLLLIPLLIDCRKNLSLVCQKLTQNSPQLNRNYFNGI